MENEYLAFVKHDIKTNTLEATWLTPVTDDAGNVVELRSTKCRNYSYDQKSEFESDCGAGSDKYTKMAGW